MMRSKISKNNSQYKPWIECPWILKRTTEIEYLRNLHIEQSQEIQRLTESLEYEQWGHAGCLSIAEGCLGWDRPSDDFSYAMIAVSRIRINEEQYKWALKNLVTALSDDTSDMDFALKQAKGLIE